MAVSQRDATGGIENAREWQCIHAVAQKSVKFLTVCEQDDEVTTRDTKLSQCRRLDE